MGICSSMNTIYQAAVNTAYYTVDCSARLLSSVDSASQITRLGTVILKVAKDTTGNPVADGFYHLCNAFSDWAGATKLPGRTFELISGTCVKRQFLGFVNIPKIVSRVALEILDYLNFAKHLVTWGFVSKEVGKILAFNLKDHVLNNIKYYSGLTAWGADLTDVIDAMYEEGPSLERWLTLLADGSKISSILLSNQTSGIPGMCNIAAQGLAPIFSITKTIVKEYHIRVPEFLYSNAQGTEDTSNSDDEDNNLQEIPQNDV